MGIMVARLGRGMFELLIPDFLMTELTDEIGILKPIVCVRICITSMRGSRRDYLRSGRRSMRSTKRYDPIIYADSLDDHEDRRT